MVNKMTKPSIFFSHSSKDKDALVVLKNIIDRKTGKALDIFLSSDGQSIPFGTNWVNRIEQGLKNAKIMFVFVTPNSINSKWIHFESGFAYSKGINVIPVGLYEYIDNLTPPLSLLQGFNISTHDSLNNIIAIINKEFNLAFAEDFIYDDLVAIKSNMTIKNNSWFNSIDSIEGIVYPYIHSFVEKPINTSQQYIKLKNHICDLLIPGI